MNLIRSYPPFTNIVPETLVHNDSQIVFYLFWDFFIINASIHTLFYLFHVFLKRLQIKYTKLFTISLINYSSKKRSKA